MENSFKIKKFCTLIYGLLIFSSTMVFGQEYTDKELGFDREALRKELLETKSEISSNVDFYLDDLRKDMVLKKKLGFDVWLESKKNRSYFFNKDFVKRFDGCESFTFNDDVNPLLGWNLSNNITPFGYTDSFDEQTTNSATGFTYLTDVDNQGRFQVFNNTQIQNDVPSTFYDEYLLELPSTINGRRPLTSAPSNIIRIGSDYTQYRKEMISKTFTLENINDFIYYNYAIILQDPGHDGRPFYSLNLSKIHNNITSSIDCATIRYEAIPQIEGFENATNNSDIKVKPWSSNVIKPSDFGVEVGDTIILEIAVSDCNAGGHFGYGYFDIECIDESDIINVSNPSTCIEDPLVFSTTLDSSNTTFTWSILDANNNSIPISNPNGNTLNYVFEQTGTYTIQLNVPYFTTTGSCDISSVFKRTIEVVDCTPCINCTSFDLVKEEKYLVSGWVKEEDIARPTKQYKTFESGYIRVSFTDVSGTEIQSESWLPTGEIIDGWQRIVGEFKVPINVDDMKLELVNRADNENIITYFDDIRVFPTKGNMKSFVYDQQTQRLMAELDENNYSTFYEYDLEGGLVRIKKETEKGVFTIQETRSGNVKKEN